MIHWNTLKMFDYKSMFLLFSSKKVLREKRKRRKEKSLFKAANPRETKEERGERKANRK